MKNYRYRNPVISSRPARPPTGIIDLRQQLRKRIAKVKQRNLTALQCFNDGLRKMEVKTFALQSTVVRVWYMKPVM